MAYVCDDCRIVYGDHTYACPHCGRRVVEDDTPEAALIQDGYRREEGPVASGPSDVAPEPISAGDDDTLASLRRAYRDRFAPAGPRGDRPNPVAVDAGQGRGPAIGTALAEPPSPVPGRYDPAPERPADPDPSTPSTGGFFAGTGASRSIDPIPTIPLYADDSQGGGAGDAFAEESRQIDRERRSLRRRYRWARFWNGVRGVLGMLSPGALIRIFIIVAVIVFLVQVWLNRALIIQAILNTVGELVPVVIVLLAIGWLVRSIFR